MMIFNLSSHARGVVTYYVMLNGEASKRHYTLKYIIRRAGVGEGKNDHSAFHTFS